MRIQPLQALAATLGSAALLFAGVADSHSGNVSAVHQATNAAYRDGMYLAKMNIRRGRKPHLVTGRWSTSVDRASFVAGYQHTYVQQAVPATTSAEWSGYRDGLMDGSRQRRSDQPFHVEKTQNYRTAGSFSDRMETKGYRIAYINGYQQAYYANTIDRRTITQVASRM